MISCLNIFLSLKFTKVCLKFIRTCTLFRKGDDQIHKNGRVSFTLVVPDCERKTRIFRPFGAFEYVFRSQSGTTIASKTRPLFVDLMPFYMGLNTVLKAFICLESHKIRQSTFIL